MLFFFFANDEYPIFPCSIFCFFTLKRIITMFYYLEKKDWGNKNTKKYISSTIASLHLREEVKKNRQLINLRKKKRNKKQCYFICRHFWVTAFSYLLRIHLIFFFTYWTFCNQVGTLKIYTRILLSTKWRPKGKEEAKKNETSQLAYSKWEKIVLSCIHNRYRFHEYWFM